MTMKERLTKAFGRDMCWCCGVQMFGTGAYTAENGETVFADYIKPEYRDEYCSEHCPQLAALKAKEQEAIKDIARSMARYKA